MKLDRAILIELCKTYGPIVKVPEGVDGVKLLWALAGNESSFGANLAPRHEPGYCRGGKYYNVLQTGAWGCLAHCSFGPWQVMFPNFPVGTSPLLVMEEPRVAASVTVDFLNRIVFGVHKAATLEQIGQCYNGGHIGADVPDYVLKLKANYLVPTV